MTNNQNKIDVDRRITELYEKIRLEGVDVIYSSFFTTCERFLDLPRPQELKFLINRMRKIHLVKDVLCE